MASFYSPIYRFLLISFLFVYACGGQPEQDTGAQSQTGAIGFQVKWHPRQDSPVTTRALPESCADLGVATVDIFIYDQSNTFLAGTDSPIDCGIRQAAINKVPAGENRVLYFLGRDSDNEVIYRGFLAGITVVAGETKDAGEIDAVPFAPSLVSPADSPPLHDSNVQFTWNTIDAAASYRIQISSDGQFSVTLADETVTASSFGHTFAASGNYFWRVRSIDTLGHESAWTSGSCLIEMDYTITASATDGGSISPNGPVTAAYGSSPVFTSTPDPGYFLSDLLVDNSPVTPVSEFTFPYVARIHSIHAVFSPESDIIHTISATAEGHGAIHVTGDPQATGTIQVSQGNTIAFEIVADDGYYLSQLKVDDADVSTTTIFTFEHVDDSHSIHAVFSEVVTPVYTITASAEPGGTIDPVGPLSVIESSTPQFTIQAAGGFRFTHIVVDTTTIAAEQDTGMVYKFDPVMDNHDIRAYFERISYPVTINTNGGGNVTIDGDPVGTDPVMVLYGESATLQISPDESNGYELTGVTVGGTPQADIDPTGISYTTQPVKGALTIDVAFALKNFTINLITGEGGGFLIDGTTVVGQVTVQHGQAVTLQIRPDQNQGYDLSKVLVDGHEEEGVSLTGFDYSIDFAAVPQSIEAVFKLRSYTINVIADPGGNFSDTNDQIVSGSLSVEHGQSITLNIKPDPGYYISRLQYTPSDGDTRDVPVIQTYIFSNVTDGPQSIEAFFKRVWFVDGDWEGNLSGPLDGLTWNTAFNNIQQAVSAAAPGDEIWVKAQQYDLSYPIYIDKNIEIYGGFHGDEYNVEQRNWQTNETILDGGGDTLTNTGSRRCLVFDPDSSGVVFSGFIVQNGRVLSLDSLSGGGAVYINQASPLITHCLFRNNSVETVLSEGGAIYNNAGSPIIDQCIFISNSTGSAEDVYGGAICNVGGGGIIRNCEFTANSALGSGSGGAIYNQNSSVLIESCQFKDNHAGQPITGSIVLGGAILNISGAPSILKCSFINNIAQGLLAGGGALANKSSAAILSNCVFAENQVQVEGAGGIGWGGAIYNDDGSNANILHCTITGNIVSGSSDAYGGGVYNLDSNPTIHNTILWGNVATTDNQLYNSSGSSPEVGNCDIDQSGYLGLNGNIRSAPGLDDYFHLSFKSPCKNSGQIFLTSPSDDIDYEPRPQESTPDIGADEYVDTYGDGLPDYWEKIFGLNPSTNNASGDPDNDGLSNTVEYQIGTSPIAANPVLNAIQRGFWDSSGFHNTSDDSTMTGGNGTLAFRSYLIFDLSGITDVTVIKAILRVELASYGSNDLSETISISDFSLDPIQVEASASDGRDIFNGLESSRTYGSFTVSGADIYDTILIDLNDNAAKDIQASLGTSKVFGFSMATMEFDKINEVISFSTGSEERVLQLILQTE